jgi:hypothetical protein
MTSLKRCRYCLWVQNTALTVKHSSFVGGTRAKIGQNMTFYAGPACP